MRKDESGFDAETKFATILSVSYAVMAAMNDIVVAEMLRK
jgi:hypothetical protein